MPSKKAAAAADSQKKRKRDKAEDVARLKKRRGQADEEETSADVPQTNGSTGQLTEPKSRAIADRPTTWKLSEPMGGSMSDIDPIFTLDEEHIIIVYRTSIQIYSTADSLLERRIKLPEEDRPLRIVAVALSPKSTELVWIGCADGALYRANWATGEMERIQRKQEPAPRLVGLTAELVQMGPLSKEVLYLSEGAPGAWSVAAYDATTLAKTAGRILFSVPSSNSTTAIDLLRTANGGRFVVGASGKTVFVGGLKATESSSQAAETLTDLAYQFYSLDAADEVSCLDVRASVHKKRGASLDLVIGCLRGAIYVYDDVFSRLQEATIESSRKKKVSVRPRKHHWHSNSVSAVKWSRDGNYFISGGPESVLVMWQTDTGKLDFLPHLSASIENIVVSPRGASYALHLDDNSSMVVSTAEMKPTFYVSGLQTLTLAQAPAKDTHVRRAYQPIDTITKPIPAAVNPTDASRIWLRVGNGQKASMTGELPSSSLLQTFDVSAFRSVGKQPLARTNPTDANITRSGAPVTEPTITHLCASRDGQWLASVDEWQPPERDISGIPGEPSLKREWARDRREVHLKFWSVTDRSSSSSEEAPSAEPEEYELVTRVDEAHFTKKAETIFAVEADTRHASRFVTLGDDGVVRFWGVKTRVRDGLVAKDDRGRPLQSWQCTQSVPLPLGESDDEASKTASAVSNSSSSSSSQALSDSKETSGSKDSSRRSGALAFSEDGSTVFAAFGGAGSDAVLYTIDAESGVVRDTLQGMFRGDVRGLAVMGASLVLLSADLRIFDIVADELRYGLRIVENVAATDIGTALNLTQLAVGRLSNTFVVAVPYKVGENASTSTSTALTLTTSSTTTTTTSSPPRLASRLIVYSPDHPEPLFTKNLPHLVVSLLPAVGLSGFLAIDAAAQVWSIADAADTTPLGQSLADLNLPTADDNTPVELNGDAAEGDNEDEEDDDDEKEDEEMQDANGAAATAGGEDDDTYGIEDTHDVVIAPQKLKEIFEAAPATAATSIEELFWQVSGLLSSLPSVARAG
ncbi:NET1-associated nuclear protein 1 [Sporothrix bragantina]|uniref:NET1-associated nuclear protein 1 n=1 Tax=Sporothrix bragantina TaxID=671064 RepID=A0ABP0C9F0_9PEZI